MGGETERCKAAGKGKEAGLEGSRGLDGGEDLVDDREGEESGEGKKSPSCILWSCVVSYSVEFNRIGEIDMPGEGMGHERKGDTVCVRWDENCVFGR